MRNKKLLDKTVINLYVDENMSFAEISEALQKKFPTEKFYPVKISRILKRNGIKAKSLSKAQKNSLEKGTKKHPTKGRKRTKEEKEAISIGLEKHWNKLDELEKMEKLDNMIEARRKMWEGLSAKEQQGLLMKMQSGKQKNKQKGSVLEKEIFDGLSKTFKNKIDNRCFLKDKSTKVDLLVNDNFVIEVDGPTHLMPIYGEIELRKKIEKDEKKNEKILSMGYNLLRVQIPRGTASKKIVRNVCLIVSEWILNCENCNKVPAFKTICVE